MLSCSFVQKWFDGRVTKAGREGGGDGVALVVHCDWSVAGDKRWSATAGRRGARWVVEVPERVEVPALLATLAERRALVGFDFPIGVPAAWAARCGLGTFVELLDALGSLDGGPASAGAGARWARFHELAVHRDEIALERPFYPRRPGGTARRHLVEGLGLAEVGELYRRCDVASGRRACPIFWTLGGNQVGRAAIAGWREVLLPARAHGHVALWPFEGELDVLLAGARSVVVETYPADAYGYMGIDSFPMVDGRRGKRVAASRAACATTVLDRMRAHGVAPTPGLERAMRDGFGDDAAGEDRFDAVMGLMLMLGVLDGRRSAGIPRQPVVEQVEGWILGRAPAPS